VTRLFFGRVGVREARKCDVCAVLKPAAGRRSPRRWCVCWELWVILNLVLNRKLNLFRSERLRISL
jgi:hypothetical protein